MVKLTRTPGAGAPQGQDAERIATQLVKSYGAEARQIAMDRADALFDLCNAKSARAWIQIVGLIEEQQRCQGINSPARTA